jgi:hypothetical protein
VDFVTAAFFPYSQVLKSLARQRKMEKKVFCIQEARLLC